MNAPLADLMRPQTIDEVVGQSHILSKDGILYRIAQSGRATNLIFYGPPGTGKTTVARIIAKQAGKKLYKLNGTTASTADFKEIISSLDTFEGMNGVVLYLDEIQYLNKKQQQTLLEFLENGQITLIASTTENPYFYIYNAIISRSTVFEFKAVSPQEIEKALERGVKLLQQQAQEEGLSLQVEDQLLRSIALSCGGDVRKSINTLEIAYLSAPIETTSEPSVPSSCNPSLSALLCATTKATISTMTCFLRCKNPSAVQTKTPPCTIWHGCWRRAT